MDEKKLTDKGINQIEINAVLPLPYKFIPNYEL
jgi:hypothetical protein